MRRFLLTLASVAGVAFAATPASAQPSLFETTEAAARANGWTVTPSLGYSSVWDDNVLVRGVGDELPNDLANTLNPRLGVTFTSPRNEFSGWYDGSFVAYRQLTALNSFDQRVAVRGRRLVTRHVALYTRGSWAEAPTTELVGLVGVPYVRVGSRLADVGGGVEAALTRRTTLTVDYGLQWIAFDPDPVLGLALLGGTSHGGMAAVRYAVTPRLKLVSTYDLQLATVIDGATFQVQNAQGGVEYQALASLQLFGTTGLSRLDYSGLQAPRTGPALRAGLTERFRTGSVDVVYSRSFVPSLGFAGTSENEEFTVRLLAPIGRRVYTRGGVAWRRNEPLVANNPKLASTWIEGSVGYAVRAWMRVEGFLDITRQTIERPGGRLERNRVGLQVITAKPMRIR